MRTHEHALLLAALVSMAPAWSGCQLFGLDDGELPITLPEIPIGPVNFASSAAREQICPPQLAGMEGSITRKFIQGSQTDLRSEQSSVDLTQYEGQITGVTVRNIDYSISRNTLDKDLQALEIHFGALSLAEDPIEIAESALDAPTARFGRTAEILGRTPTPGRVAVKQDPDGAEGVRDHLSTFQFSTLFSTEFELTPDDCANLHGDLEVMVWIQITFFVDPI